MLVTAVMPTRGRRELAAKALACFIAQTYPERELLILDDADEPSFPDGIPGGEATRCVHRIVIRQRLSIPEKRNYLAGICTSEIMLNIDSDDWSAPVRMEQQVEQLRQTNAAVVGYHSILFWNEANRSAYKYSYGNASYASGSSLCFLKSWWKDHPFPENKKLGSDNEFVYKARDLKRLNTVDGGQMLVARIHTGNSNKKVLGANFKPVPLSALPSHFMETL